MPKSALTDLAVQKLPEGLHLDGKTAGFGIRVGKTRKTWIVIRGKNRTKEAIGHYPAMTLSEARKRAQAALLTEPSINPQKSFKDALEDFLALPRWRPQSQTVLKSSLKHFDWTRTLDKITHEDVARALEAIKAPSARAHALKDIRTFFNWCVPRYLSASPAAGLKMDKQPSRARVLTDAELKAVWNACEGNFGIIVKLLILTGQRRSEITCLTSDMISADRITLPATLTKNGREHAFPLTAHAKSLIALKKGIFFPATKSLDGKAKPMSGFSVCKANLDKRANITGWTLHDLRRTFATNCAKLAIPIHVTEKILNHVSGTTGGLVAIYNRHTYFAEMKEALEKHEAFVLALLAG